MAARIAKEHEESQDGGYSAPASGRRVDGTKQEIAALNVMAKKPGEVAQLIEFSSAPKGG